MVPTILDINLFYHKHLFLRKRNFLSIIELTDFLFAIMGNWFEVLQGGAGIANKYTLLGFAVKAKKTTAASKTISF